MFFYCVALYAISVLKYCTEYLLHYKKFEIGISRMDRNVFHPCIHLRTPWKIVASHIYIKLSIVSRKIYL